RRAQRVVRVVGQATASCMPRSSQWTRTGAVKCSIHAASLPADPALRPGEAELQLCGSGVFFFQAEDGIRDATVTGVQTCALPISAIRWARSASLDRPDRVELDTRERADRLLDLRVAATTGTSCVALRAHHESSQRRDRKSVV